MKFFVIHNLPNIQLTLPERHHRPAYMKVLAKLRETSQSAERDVTRTYLT